MFGWKCGGPNTIWEKVSLLNVREYQRAIQKWQSRKPDNLGYTRRNRTTQKITQCMLDNAMHTQTQLMQISHAPSTKQLVKQ